MRHVKEVMVLFVSMFMMLLLASTVRRPNTFSHRAKKLDWIR